VIQYEPFNIVLILNNEEVKITVIPIDGFGNEKPFVFDIVINEVSFGDVNYIHGQWVSYSIEDKELVELIGKCIYKLYDKGERIFKRLIPAKLFIN
jgi:hypothetical protein